MGTLKFKWIPYYQAYLALTILVAIIVLVSKLLKIHCKEKILIIIITTIITTMVTLKHLKHQLH
jgi:uncharacterized metal-binding protein